MDTTILGIVKPMECVFPDMFKLMIKLSPWSVGSLLLFSCGWPGLWTYPSFSYSLPLHMKIRFLEYTYGVQYFHIWMQPVIALTYTLLF